MIHPILFIILAAIAVAAALGMLLSRNAVYSALYLVLNFITIAVFFLVLNAPFIAMVQITVYAGAIVVLFLFVIMLLGAERLRGVADVTLPGQQYHRMAAIVMSLGLVAVFVVLLLQGNIGGTELAPAVDSSPRALGQLLFGSYVFPFEVTGVLLIAAIAGVVIFGHVRKRSQQDA